MNMTLTRRVKMFYFYGLLAITGSAFWNIGCGNGGGSGRPFNCQISTARTGTLTGSNSLSYKGNYAVGTLGLMVHDHVTGQPRILTNCHVAYDNVNGCPTDWLLRASAYIFDDATTMKGIGQPVKGDGQGYNDWALINISYSGWNYDGKILGLPAIKGITRLNGAAFVKYWEHIVNSPARVLHGATTIVSPPNDQVFGLTENNRQMVGGSGDSGTVILTETGDELIGLFYGVSDYPRNLNGKVQQIQDVLTAAQADYYDPDTHPVGFFRYRHAQGNDTHLYTADWGEEAFGDSKPWTYDTTVGGILRTKTQPPPKDLGSGKLINMVQLRRYLRTDGSGDTLYTTSSAEHGNGDQEYCYQGPVGYIPEEEVTNVTTKLYRYKNGANHHFYTTDRNEAGGWTPDSPEFYYIFAKHGPPDPPSVFQGPPDAQIEIDPSCSSATLSVGDKSATTSVSGLINITIGPDCHDPICSLSVSSINLTGADFMLDNHQISQIAIRNYGYSVGSWTIDDTFSIATGAASIQSNFNLDGDPLGFTTTNDLGPIRGTLSRAYLNFTMTGDFANQEGAMRLSLCGHPIARPPVAVLTPPGPFECDSPEGAHVAFSSAQSFDPDDDIVHRLWTIDKFTVGTDVLTISPILSLGSHPVSLAVSDSRGATSTVSETVLVQDSLPPQLDLQLSQRCIWPPNHKMALYAFGNGLNANTRDLCDASPGVRIVNVTSNQPATGGGSGGTPIDVKFGKSAFCVRAERDGTLSTPREYTLTVEASDSSGHKTTQEVVILVPANQSGGPGCDMPMTVVADDDVRCIQ